MNNLQDRTHFCYLILHLVDIQRCQIFRGYDRTPGLSHFLTNKQTIGTSSRGTGCKWSLTVAAVRSVCDLPGDRWQVPGHLLLCYLWGASQPRGLCEENAGARRADGFINHRQAEADRESIHCGSSTRSCLHTAPNSCTHISTHKKPVWVFYSWQAAKAPKIASWDSKDFKWVNTSFITHLVVQKVTHTHTNALKDGVLHVI